MKAQPLAAEILLFSTPTWLGRPSSIAQRVLERMDAMLSEGDSETEEGHEWSHSTGRALAANPAPPSG